MRELKYTRLSRRKVFSACDLKKSIRNENGVLNALQMHPYMSTFDMSENLWLVKILDSLKEKGLIVELSEPYPLHKFLVTDEGIKAITI
jgi:hypothetical protein